VVPRSERIDERDLGASPALGPLDARVRLTLGDAPAEGQDAEPRQGDGDETEEHPSPTLSSAAHDVFLLA
jgi:hypothetical protein